jgi:beta-ribofuranosylaminobenzene 5'-phosphate synthase
VTVTVETAGRLHFGVLDLRASAGRWFGGIGAAAPAPTLRLTAELPTDHLREGYGAPSTLNAEAEGGRHRADASHEADALDVTGEDAGRAREFARRFLAFHQLPLRARIHVERALPSHAGLGSGTQLALAVGSALAALYGIPADAASLARATGRARRSAIGTWTFAGGGLVVEGGRRPDRDDCGPLLARLPLPAEWRCVVAVPDARSPMTGDAEAAAFAALPLPPDREVQRVAQLVLMALLPAAADADLAVFGSALTEIQEITGAWFAPAQGGTFAAGTSAELVRRMREWGAAGVGQSSWGPTVYGIVSGEAEGRRLAERVRAALGGDGTVYDGAFPQDGAKVVMNR